MASNSYLDNTGLAYFKSKLASWIPSWFPSQTGQSGKVLTTNGSSLSWTTPAASVTTDGVSIDTNGNGELEAIGVMNANANGTALKSWSGTKAQYNALATKDATTLYHITDDSSISADILDLLYPVGAIYIGVMATCPLAALGIGTWTLVASDLSLQGSGTNAAGTTLSAGLPNLVGGSDNVLLSGGGTSATGVFAGNGYYTQWGGFTTNPNWNIASGGGERYRDLNFDASRSNAIYGASNTVQPPAYVVNVWQRTA